MFISGQVRDRLVKVEGSILIRSLSKTMSSKFGQLALIASGKSAVIKIAVDRRCQPSKPNTKFDRKNLENGREQNTVIVSNTVLRTLNTRLLNHHQTKKR